MPDTMTDRPAQAAEGLMMRETVAYWLKGQAVQNFGDFLSVLLLEKLFIPFTFLDREYRIIGSCLHDDFVPPSAWENAGRPGHDTTGEAGTPPTGPIFWACGLRDAGGLSPERQRNCDILAVRGPLSRSALRLGAATPIGDAGLLLPALHPVSEPARREGDTLLIPHFHDRRSDEDLLAQTGCGAVLRPNIPNDPAYLYDMIERIAAADFVLCGSLHGAIIAAAYGTPFGFWQSGQVDLPFKWQDFAASVNIPCIHHTDLAAARAHYAADIAPVLHIPVLWPLLAVAPLMVRPDAFVKVVAMDIRRHGIAALDRPVPSHAANQICDALRRLREQEQDMALLVEHMQRGQEDARQSHQTLTEKIKRLEAQYADSSQEEQRLHLVIEELQEKHEQASLAWQQERDRASGREAALLREAQETQAVHTAREAALAQALQDSQDAQAGLAGHAQHLEDRYNDLDRQYSETRQYRDELWLHLENTRALYADASAQLAQVQETAAAQAASYAVMEQALVQSQAREHALVASTTWRLMAPMRRAGRHMPWMTAAMRRGARLAWWTATLRLPQKLSARRQLLQQIAVLSESPLFNREYYVQQRPDVLRSGQDPVLHYILFGAQEGNEPQPLFDSQWYRARCGEALPEGMTPLAHYILSGARRSIDPHPLFDTAWYLSQAPLAKDAASPLEHYLTQGAAAGHWPSRLFHGSGYLYEYEDARQSSLDPLSHYSLYGAARGYDPHPLFDTDWYAEQYRDALAGWGTPLAHYLHAGESEGYHACALMRDVNAKASDDGIVFPWRDAPEVSIVIPSYGHFFETFRCLYMVARNTGDWVGYEVIVIDDKPSAPLAPLLAEIENLRVLRNEINLGFLRSCNRAAAEVRGWHIAFLNNDTYVGRDWLDPLLKVVRENPRAGMVGCKLLNTDGTVQEAGGIILRDGWGEPFGKNDDPTKPDYNYLRPVDAVIGAAFLVRRECFERAGGFDDRYAPAFYEEFDLAFTIRKHGYDVIYQPESEVVHLGSNSYGAEMRDQQSRHNHAQFCVKWAEELASQPERGSSLFLARQRPPENHLGIILMIDDKVPEYDRHAGALTIFQYVKLILGIGFRIVYAPASMEPLQPYTRTLQRLGVEVLYSPVTLEGWLRENGNFLHAIWTARPDITAPILDMLRRYSPARILYYPHDLHYLRERRRYDLSGDGWALEESIRLQKLEFSIFKAVDFIMTPSPEEAVIIAEQGGGKRVRVIPPYLYPADSARQRDEAACASRKDVLFIGGFNHPPNVDAALILVQQIMPIVWAQMPDVHVLIVGDNPPAEIQALGGAKVTVTGYVPDIAPCFDQARISISPLRYGAGVKGKIVTSLQEGVPVVTTAIGNEGIGLRDGEEVMLGETPDELAAAALRLLQDDALCARLSAGGAAVIQKRFSEALACRAVSEVLGVDVCRVCGHVTFKDVDDVDTAKDNWREAFACTQCYALNRTEALADAIVAPLRHKGGNSIQAVLPFFARQRIHEFSIVGPIVDRMRHLPLFTCSEYVDGVPSGAYSKDGIFCQDIQAQSFRDEEFDLLISQDVFEHVPDAERGFREIHRVLKPGGRHIFTIPYHPTLDVTMVRAELRSDGIHHLILPPVYHGDPLREEGALTFREFGRDLIPLLERIGFDVSLQETSKPVHNGYVAVFVTTKRA